jgi:DNA-directed RNA polymerase specialized sigma subunit
MDEVILDNAIDYSNKNNVKTCIKQLNKLESDNKTGLCIYCDLMDAIQAVCTKRQKQIIYYYCIMQYTQQETGDKIGISKRTVVTDLQNIIGNISNYLTEDNNE